MVSDVPADSEPRTRNDSTSKAVSDLNTTQKKKWKKVSLRVTINDLQNQLMVVDLEDYKVSSSDSLDQKMPTVAWVKCGHQNCHGLVAATRYLDLHFPYQTADSSFSISDLISSPLPIVVTRYFFMLLVPSPSLPSLPSPSGTFRSRLLYVLSCFSLLPMLLTCSG
jgi:hypothetical protein